MKEAVGGACSMAEDVTRAWHVTWVRSLSFSVLVLPAINLCLTLQGGGVTRGKKQLADAAASK